MWSRSEQVRQTYGDYPHFTGKDTELHWRKSQREAASIFPMVRSALQTQESMRPRPPGADRVIMVHSGQINHEGAIALTEVVNIYVQCK